MEDQIVGLKLQVDGSGAEKSVGNIRKEIKEATAELIKAQGAFGDYSKEALTAAKRVAELKDKVSEAAETAELFDPGKKFQAYAGALNAVAGGFAAVQGALGLIGVESEEVEKQLLKVQSALALSQGLSTISDSVKDFKRLGAELMKFAPIQQANAVANRLAAATMTLFGASVNTTSVAFRVLKGAIAATGIGLLVVALGSVVEAFTSFESAAKRAAQSQKDFNEQAQKLADVGLKAELAFIERNTKLRASEAKARGASAEEIRKIEEGALDLRRGAYQRFYERSGKDTTEAGIAAKQQIDDLNADIIIRENNAAGDRLKNENDAADKRLAANKSEGERRLAEQKAQRQKEADERAAFEERAAQRAIEREKIRITAKREIEEQRKAERDASIEAAEESRSKFAQNGQAQLIEVSNGVIDAAQNQFAVTSEIFSKYQELYAADAEAYQELQDAKYNAAQAGLNLLAAVAGDNEKLANLIYAVQKALEIGKIISSTASSIAQVTAGVASIPAILPPGVPNPSFAVAAAVGAKKIATLKIGAGIGIASIAATSIAKFKGGSGSVGGGGGDLQGGGIGGAAPIAPQVASPQLGTTQLAQATINQLQNANTRAYVVESDITGAQSRVTRLNRAARLG
jgi:hypothetical protein